MNIIKILLLSFLLSLKLFSVDFGFETVQGKYTASKEDDLPIANLFGIRNNFCFSKNFALSLKYDLVDNKKVTNLQRYTLATRFQSVFMDNKFQPFFDLGLGKELGFTNDRYLQATLGAKYFLTDEFNLMGEANYIKKKDKGQSYFFAMGLGYDFFRKPSTGRYTQEPIDEATMKSLAKQKIDTTEDIFLSPY